VSQPSSVVNRGILLLESHLVDGSTAGTWIFVASIVFVAAFLQTSTGFGFSQVTVPFLITIIAPRDAIQVTLILSLAISLTMLRATTAEVDTGLLKRWIWSALAGLPVGVILFHVLPVLWIKIVLAASLGVAIIFLSFRLRLRRTPRRDALSGFASGALTASVGLPGPPLLVYTSSVNLEKSAIRSTTLTFHTVVYGFGIVSQIVTQGISGSVLVMAGLLLAPLLMGIGVGHGVFPLISQRMFKWLLYAILLCTELYLLSSL
jgi:uncharacterized membrane protein YfcA